MGIASESAAQNGTAARLDAHLTGHDFLVAACCGGILSGNSFQRSCAIENLPVSYT